MYNTTNCSTLARNTGAQRLCLLFVVLFFAFPVFCQFKAIAPAQKPRVIEGAVIGLSCNYIAYELTENKAFAFITGVGVSALVGCVKESYDLKHTGIYSYGDIRATVIGGIIGSSVVSLITLTGKPRRKQSVDFEFRLDDESTMIKK